MKTLFKLMAKSQGYIQTNVLDLDKKSYFSNSKVKNITSHFTKKKISNISKYLYRVTQSTYIIDNVDHKKVLLLNN